MKNFTNRSKGSKGIPGKKFYQKSDTVCLCVFYKQTEVTSDYSYIWLATDI